mmetsp:Transcript_42962/g.102197  ORF Transcript_42962/g.102197 Transcript_42962/m.102197 type:complete len:135 (-) Transcript_42962:298-702(-)|eukprot:CAMPEP_0180144900 /NCGR_PEP_ID=MMETSP0986-20121125/17298_1 /TAXON_ID=697907 /ORGANISM="non described non described, Strain CCMP2293" /LENGTH=134 /DNA_ID=CAMNT_0022089071 /DNA_START=77 /DNA_END=481 /DNA_ORIENTATION=-
MAPSRWLVGACAVAACALEVSAFAPSSGALVGLRRGSAQCGLVAPAANSRRAGKIGILAASASVDTPARIAEIEAVLQELDTYLERITGDVKSLGEKVKSKPKEIRAALESNPEIKAIEEGRKQLLAELALLKA